MSGATLGERLDPWRALALRDLLEVDVDVAPGAPLPLLWHWVYLLDHPTPGELGPDGHRARPPAELHLRRMWAGGRVTQLAPLLTDRPATRESEERSRVRKVGSTGEFVVVTVGHTISQDGVVAVDEEQHLIYRQPVEQVPTRSARERPDPRGAPAPVPPMTAGERSWPVDERMLFRYSALTYNGHRIHYDRPYATSVEGYGGLVVHGPLQALLMAEHCAARANARREPATFSYRLVAPLVDGQGLVTGVDLAGGEHATHVRDRSGRRTATGTYRLLGEPDREVVANPFSPNFP